MERLGAGGVNLIEPHSSVPSAMAAYLGLALLRWPNNAGRGLKPYRRFDNGRQVQLVARLAMAASTSVNWCGYLQRLVRNASADYYPKLGAC